MVARHVDEMHEQFREALGQPIEMIRQNPMAAMLVAFGAGLGLGVLITQAMREEEREPLISGRTKRHIYDAVSNMLPTMLKRQLEQFTS